MHDYLNNQRFRSVRLLSAVAAVAIAVAACGSSGSTGSTTPNRTDPQSSAHPSTHSGSMSTLAFSKCMRSHGVPNFPDLGSNGMLIQANTHTITVNGISVNAPAFQTARAHCQRYLPSQKASQAQAAQQRQRQLKFAKCMRSHGVPNFPDPKVISSHGGNQQVYLRGINLQAPAFQTAAKACGGGPKGP